MLFMGYEEDEEFAGDGVGQVGGQGGGGGQLCISDQNAWCAKQYQLIGTDRLMEVYIQLGFCDHGT